MPDHDAAMLVHYLVVGAMLFGLGATGFLARRNIIVMFLCAEMMLQGVSLSLVAWSRYHDDFGGQLLVLFIIAVAACEAAIALALVLMLFRRRGSLDIVLWQDLREADQPPAVDRELPESPPEPAPEWPRLAPAGRQPEVPREETEYRPHV
ncbi:MAG: NADH-quinone oxidoreductase subunit NuoK [Thermoguttaceae bacterium]|jgi:NADH-quinone oxidoreductase subunit K|nr:NADH-quinone oxidoreductase subunit NuoK [Thermoguttaceae bacterium]